MSPKISIVALAAVFLLAACGSPKDANKKNFSKAIQIYLDTQHGVCVPTPIRDSKNLDSFTIEEDSLYAGRKEWANAFVAIDFLKSEEAEVEKKGMFGKTHKVKVTRYDVTDLGKKYLKQTTGFFQSVAGFCKGKLEVDEVENFTEPADAFGMRVSQVSYKQKLKGADDWIKKPEIQQAFPKLQEEIEGKTHKAVLILTSGGWLHEKMVKN